MSLITVALRRPITIIMLFMIPICLGIISFPKLPVERFPRTNFPFVSVNVSYPGAAPGDVETQITERIENALVGLSGVAHIISNSNAGSSQVNLQFSEDTDQTLALTEVTRRIGSVRRQLPAGAGEPGINAGGGDFGSTAMNISIASDRLSLEELFHLVDTEIAPEIQQVSGVANVDVSGGRQEQIQVRVDPLRMQTHTVTLTQIQNALRNWNLTTPGGLTRTDTLVFNTRTMGQSQTTADLEQVVIVAAGGQGANALTQPVYLKDVASIVVQPRIQTTYQRLNGRESVGMRITQVSGANSLVLSDRLHEKLNKLIGSYGQSAGVTATVTSEQAKFTRVAVEDTMRSLYLAVLLAGLVLVLFLHNLRNTFIVLMAVPASLIPTFFVMNLMGLTLNTVSLMGLALVIGILVDDSIVVIENINRHLQLGETPWEAARKGVSEIGLATVAITLTSMSVFVPLTFMTGNVGRLFRELGLVMSTAIFFSLLVSLLVTPMLASRLLKEGEQEGASGGGPWGAFSRAWERGFTKLSNGYRRTLAGALRFRWIPVLTGFAMLGLVFTFLPLKLVSTEYVPREDNNQFSVNISMPPGTAVGLTDAAARTVEARLAAIPEVEAVATSVGGGGGGGGGERNSNIDVDLVDRSERTRSVFEILNDVRTIGNDIPGAQVRTSVPSVLGGGGGGGVSIIARGPDPDTLQKVANDVLRVVRSIPGTTEARTSALVPAPELRFVIDPVKAVDLGVTPQVIGATVNAAVSGSQVSVFRPDGGEQRDIVVLLEGAERLTPAQLGALPVSTSRNTIIRLDQVATIVPGSGPAQISRYDRQRQLQISASLTGRPLGDVLNDFEEQVKQMQLPLGYSVQVTGQGSQLNTAFAGLTAAGIMSIIFMFMLLAALYESMVYPWAVLLSLPVALVGAFLGLAITGNTINIFSMMGMILLIGLVAKNGILLIDYTNTLRREGMDRRTAILNAGPTRLRPILMTTFSVCFALLPLAFKLGAGGESRAPLAVAVIGGVLCSTLLTLVMIPCAYTYLDDLQGILLRLGGRLRSGRKQIELVPAPAFATQAVPVAALVSGGAATANGHGIAATAHSNGGVAVQAAANGTNGHTTEPAATNGNGHGAEYVVAPNGTNGHAVSNGSGSNGHALSNGNGNGANGHDDGSAVHANGSDTPATEPAEPERTGS